MNNLKNKNKRRGQKCINKCNTENRWENVLHPEKPEK